MTAVAVEYRLAMDSCMVGIRLCWHGALPAPDFSDPGEYPEGMDSWRRDTLTVSWTESIASANVSTKEFQY